MEHVFIGYVVYLILSICLFLLYILISITKDLIEYAVIINESEDNLAKIIMGLLFTLLIFMLLPDTLYGVMYSVVFPFLENTEYSALRLIYYSFILHYGVPMVDSYSAIHSQVASSSVLSFINFVHVYSIKIIDTVVIASFITTLLCNKLIYSRFTKKDMK